MSFGVQPTKGRTDGTFSIEFAVFPEDGGNPRVDIEGNPNNEIAIFPDAVENFQLRYREESEAGDTFTFDSISIGFGEESSSELELGIPDPITLDLVARKGEIDLFGTVYPSIEYSFVGGELTAFGINELSIILLDADADDTNGFQVFLDIEDLISDVDPELAEFTINPEKAINDISYITEGDESLPEPLPSLLALADVYSVSAPSASDPTVIENITGIFQTTGENFLIEAEDLTLDGVYQVEPEPIGSGEDSFEVISLRDSLGDELFVTGEASFIVGSEQVDISGISDIDQVSVTISTFDESDGAGTIEVLAIGEGEPKRAGVFDDGEFKEVLTLDETPEELGLNLPSEDIRKEFTFSFGEGEIEAGDEIIIRGTSNLEEFVRLDFIDVEVIDFAF